MAAYFYAVELSRDEEVARTPSYVDKFLVELVCRHHHNEDRCDSDRGEAASEIAVSAAKERYGLAGFENIGDKKATRYTGSIPAEPRLQASCGCRVWYL